MGNPEMRSEGGKRNTGAPARVTIFIPTYNRAHLLAGAIESALAQPFSHVVVSDNRSTDCTADVVGAYYDPRLTYVRPHEHLGLNEHFNLCLDRAETEFVFLLPDDDRMAPVLVESALAVLDGNPRVGLVHGQVDVVDADGGLIAASHDMTGLEGDAIESGAEFIRRSMAMSYRVHASTALIRTAALDGVRLDERDFPVTDFGLWLRLALGWDVAFLARPLATYRIHGGTYSSGAAAVTDGGYIQGADRVATLRGAKLRFLDEHGDAVGDAETLPAIAERAFRGELVAYAEHAAGVERRLVPTVGALAHSLRLDPRVALEPSAWRLLAGGVLGRRGISLVKRIVHRPSPTVRPA